MINESEQYIRAHISSKAENHESLSQTDISDDLDNQCRTSVTRGWIGSLLLRHRDKLLEITSFPQEKPRIQVLSEFLAKTVECFKDQIAILQAEMVFNLDFVSISV
jgi:hypothetical protein